MIALEEGATFWTTDFWVVVSNLGLISVTLLSIREEHKTLRAAIDSNNKLIRKVLRLLGVKQHSGRHTQKERSK